MSSSVPIRRVAGLQLRGPRGPVRVRIAWPDVRRAGALLVLLSDDGGEDAVAVCAHTGLVVLEPVRGADPLHDATTAVEWAAEHAAAIDADADGLLVGGGALADLVLARARAAGWPAVTRLERVP